jgi:hypothetical protein
VVSDSVHEQIREWWRERLDGREEVSLPELASEGANHFRADAEFCERYLDETLRETVYLVGVGLLSKQRGAVQRSAAPKREQSRLTQVSADQIVARIEDRVPDWSRWMEHDPVSGRHVSLFSMTKKQALAAAEAREKRADPDLRRAALLRLAAGRLDAGQRIEEVWSAELLADIERRLEVVRPTYALGGQTIYEMMQEGAA